MTYWALMAGVDLSPTNPNFQKKSWKTFESGAGIGLHPLSSKRRTVMTCPYCGYPDQRVLESRDARDGEAIRRRRECLQCERRFTTFETYERATLYVVKRDGKREGFSREKLLTSMVLACGKRPISMEKLQSLVASIEREIYQKWEEEVPSTAIGESVMCSLRELDPVAYVRYASVYQEFQTAADFSRAFPTGRSVSKKT